MNHHSQELEEIVRRWRASGLPIPAAALVAGSGLGVDFPASEAPPWRFDEVLPFNAERIEGHDLRWEIVEMASGESCLYLRGRVHAYQGYSAADVVFGVRLAALLGARVLLVTNAAGGLLPGVQPGALVAIRDQINLSGLNPLVGVQPREWGHRFTDMVGAYDPSILEIAVEVARSQDFELPTGVYAGLLGPSFETPAEVAMLRRLGADLVGMSTVLEVIAARQLGMRCCGISFVTNLAAGLEGPNGEAAVLDHEDVLRITDAGRGRMRRFLSTLLPRIASLSPPSRFA